MDENIERHRAFVTAVTEGSFTKAAERLFCSQSSISRAIAELEGEWGVTLLKRNRSGVTLTAEGEALLPSSRNILASYEALQENVDALRGLQSGSIRIGVISSIATHCLPSAIRAFRHDYPAIEYELLLGDYSEIESWVREGRIDCGFVRMPAAADLDCISYAEDELMAVLPSDHTLAQGESVALNAFCNEPFLALEHGSNTEVAALFKHAGLSPKAALRTWDDHAIMAMVEQGLGIAILPELVLKRTPYDVACLPLRPRCHRELCIIMRKDVPHSLALQRFLPYLTEEKHPQS